MSEVVFCLCNPSNFEENTKLYPSGLQRHPKVLRWGPLIKQGGPGLFSNPRILRRLTSGISGGPLSICPLSKCGTSLSSHFKTSLRVALNFWPGFVEPRQVSPFSSFIICNVFYDQLYISNGDLVSTQPVNTCDERSAWRELT